MCMTIMIFCFEGNVFYMKHCLNYCNTNISFIKIYYIHLNKHIPVLTASYFYVMRCIMTCPLVIYSVSQTRLPLRSSWHCVSDMR